MQTTSGANGSRIGLYMDADTSRRLIAKSKSIRAHVLLVRQVEEERGPLVIRNGDRRDRKFQTMQDLLDYTERRVGERRFDRTSL